MEEYRHLLSVQHNPPLLNDNDHAIMQMYSLYGKEVEVLHGVHKGLRGIVKGFCYLHVIVRVYSRPTEGTLIPIGMLRVVTQKEIEDRLAMPPPPIPSRAVAASKVQLQGENGQRQQRRRRQQQQQAQLPNVPDSVNMLDGPMTDFFAGWTLFTVYLQIPVDRLACERLYNAILMISQGQISRHAPNDDRRNWHGIVTSVSSRDSQNVLHRGQQC